MIVFIKLSDLTPEPKYFHQDLLGKNYDIYEADAF